VARAQVSLGEPPERLTVGGIDLVTALVAVDGIMQSTANRVDRAHDLPCADAALLVLKYETAMFLRLVDLPKIVVELGKVHPDAEVERIERRGALELRDDRAENCRAVAHLDLVALLQGKIIEPDSVELFLFRNLYVHEPLRLETPG